MLPNPEQPTHSQQSSTYTHLHLTACIETSYASALHRMVTSAVISALTAEQTHQYHEATGGLLDLQLLCPCVFVQVKSSLMK